nr:sericin-1-like [Nerophis lumbriciformis]
MAVQELHAAAVERRRRMAGKVEAGEGGSASRIYAASPSWDSATDAAATSCKAATTSYKATATRYSSGSDATSYFNGSKSTSYFRGSSATSYSSGSDGPSYSNWSNATSSSSGSDAASSLLQRCSQPRLVSSSTTSLVSCYAASFREVHYMRQLLCD